MTFRASVICDSVGFHGVRLTTLQLRYPRFIHAEFLTHRDKSRNSSSSRAIPVARLIQDVLDDTAMPIFWGKNEPGMQARAECEALIELCENGRKYSRVALWMKARDQMVRIARAYSAAGYHKQIVNRLLEPFAHINTVVSATNWDNFFTLRDHEDAQPEIRTLARMIREARDHSVPQTLAPGMWHVPYLTKADTERPVAEQLKISTARCARTSYLTHDGKDSDPEKDIKLHDRLVGAEPLHASPAEHQASCLPDDRRVRNFRGFQQYRVFLEEAA